MGRSRLLIRFVFAPLTLDLAVVTRPKSGSGHHHEESSHVPVHCSGHDLWRLRPSGHNAILSADPAAEVITDPPARKVRVTTQADEQALVAALAEARYPAEPAAA